MEVLRIAIGFAAAWLACGLGFWIAVASVRGLAPHPVPIATGESGRRIARRWAPLQAVYVLPLAVAVALLVAGIAGIFTVVPL